MRLAGRILFLSVAVVALCACLRDLSGLTRDGQGRILAVNNRPGAFAHCKRDGDKLQCKRLGFARAGYERFDFEGVCWVGENLFYAVSEKRDNQCLSGCNLSQDITAFRYDEQGKVAAASCSGLSIPLYEGDDPNCSFANCGLEGIAYDPDRNLLYVAKESHKPRLFAVQLDSDHCPTGSFAQVHPPMPKTSYNDLAYSSRYKSLFVLSATESFFYAWHLPTGRVIFSSDRMLKLRDFLRNNPVTEGIFIDDETGTIMLLAESGAFISAKLPPLKLPAKKD